MKGNYRRILIVFVLGVVAGSFSFYLGGGQAHVDNYVANIFLPMQRWKNLLLNHISISIGDYLYLLLFLLLLLIVGRIVYYAVTFARSKVKLLRELLRLVVFCLSVYLVFFISWGGNYYRPGLAHRWDEGLKKSWSASSLLQVNSFLVDKLNSLSDSGITYPSLSSLNQTAYRAYRREFDCQLPQLKAKASSLGRLLNYAGVHGYYNPLTGEAQFNRDLPPFMHPFVIAHEMAHQAGIAAEDDANLLAYIIGVNSHHAAFRYSAYFNVFLYSFSDLKERDTVQAKMIWSRLNDKTKQDYQSLLAVYKRYKSFIRGASNDVYDYYLKWNGEQKGLDSYNMVVRWVYFWELEAKERADLSICPFR